jgi:hypothetical protein
MKTSKNKITNIFIICTFVGLYLLTSIVSTIHVVDFFKLSNPNWLAITLAIGFELGAAASLAALVILEKMNKTLIWSLFITITLVQMQGNMYYAYSHISDFKGWIELFDLVEWEPIAQKRILAAVSGAILPLVALGFIKSLVDYIRPESIIEKEDSFEYSLHTKDIKEEKDLFEYDVISTDDNIELKTVSVEKKATEAGVSNSINKSKQIIDKKGPLYPYRTDIAPTLDNNNNQNND